MRSSVDSHGQHLLVPKETAIFSNCQAALSWNLNHLCGAHSKLKVSSPSCFQLVSRLNQNSALCIIYVFGLWLEQEGCPDMGYTKLIAVHAGLESNKPVDTQLQTLRERNATTSRIEQLAGRKNVWNTPPVSLSSTLFFRFCFLTCRRLHLWEKTQLYESFNSFIRSHFIFLMMEPFLCKNAMNIRHGLVLYSNFALDCRRLFSIGSKSNRLASSIIIVIVL